MAPKGEAPPVPSTSPPKSSPNTNGKKSTRFQPGNPGGPGRPKGSLGVTQLLDDAIQAAQQRRNQLQEPCSCATHLMSLVATPEQLWAKSCRTLDEHFARRAFLNDKVLIAFQHKRIPDLQHQTGDGHPVAVHIHYGHEQARVQIAQPLGTNGH